MSTSTVPVQYTPMTDGIDDFTQNVDRKFSELVVEHYFNLGKRWLYFPIHQLIIDTRKTFPDGKNMFDRLYEDNIDAETLPQAQKLFPPNSLPDLMKLVKLIESSKTTHTLQDDLQQNCLIYYILKDADVEAAEEYADEVLIPAAYRHFMTGCHALDRGNMELTVEQITYPGTATTYPDAVVQAINNQSTLQKKRQKGDELIVWYFDSMVPKHVTHECMTIYIASLARLDPMSALTYIRSLTAATQSAAFECLVKSCVDERNQGGVWRLGNLPFTKNEGEMLEQALDHVSSDEQLNNDILVTRSLHLGEVREAKHLINVAVEKRGGEERWGEYKDALGLY